MRQLLRRVINRVKRSIGPDPIHEENFGVKLGEWPARSEQAVRLIEAHAQQLGPSLSLADWGCGRQGVRRIISPDWSYMPYDRIMRSPDTRIVDFNLETPKEEADIIVCLGLLEYVDDFWGVLGAAIAQSKLCCFSYVGAYDEAARRKNGWKASHDFDAVEAFLADRNTPLLEIFGNERTDWIALVAGDRLCR